MEKVMIKNNVFGILFLIAAVLVSAFVVACGQNECKELQLMGAGERIHDSYTFANNGVMLEKLQENQYLISGRVDYLSSAKVKDEFDIDPDISHVVVLKLCNCSGNQTVPEQVEVAIDGMRNYDAEHLNGTDYTYIILEAVPAATTTITVKWNSEMEPIIYSLKMADDLQLLENS